MFRSDHSFTNARILIFATLLVTVSVGMKTNFYGGPDSSDVENQLLSPVKRIHSEQRLLELMALQRMRQNAKKLMFLKKRRFDYEDDPYGYV
ncbi:unnamed protein product [Calicophoron daubneyi]|uniref:Uncharacterized protein n=1 Tax=Calicophoron daubneyi TaxID=300641 RepID=A0AAV2TRR3_CALDB